MNTESPTEANHIDRRVAVKRVGVLLGGALSAPAVSGVLSGCQADPSADWALVVLSAGQNEMVTAMTEHIIPATDTPGAKAAHVNRFIDKMMDEWYGAEERRPFLEGLEAVDARCRREHGQPFLECSEKQQFALLKHLDQKAFVPNNAGREGERQSGDPEEAESDAGEPKKGGAVRTDEAVEDAQATDSTRAAPEPERPAAVDSAFHRLLKELTLLGYYTSEIGMNQELGVKIVPGRYEGCVPVEEVRPNLA